MWSWNPDQWGLRYHFINLSRRHQQRSKVYSEYSGVILGMKPSTLGFIFRNLGQALAVNRYSSLHADMLASRLKNEL
jgi:hypothetical protein